MTDDRKTGKRKQVYMAARHIAWWERLPRYDRSRIIAEALDLWREKHQPIDSSIDSSPDTKPTSTKRRTA